MSSETREKVRYATRWRHEDLSYRAGIIVFHPSIRMHRKLPLGAQLSDGMGWDKKEGGKGASGKPVLRELGWTKGARPRSFPPRALRPGARCKKLMQGGGYEIHGQK